TRTITPGPSATPTRTPTSSPTASPTITPTSCPYTACDFFNRSDSASQLGMTTVQTGYNYSGQAESGQPWQTDGTVWGIASNQAYVISPTGSGNYARLDSTGFS